MGSQRCKQWRTTATISNKKIPFFYILFVYLFVTCSIFFYFVPILPSQSHYGRVLLFIAVIDVNVGKFYVWALFFFRCKYIHVYLLRFLCFLRSKGDGSKQCRRVGTNTYIHIGRFLTFLAKSVLFFEWIPTANVKKQQNRIQIRNMSGKQHSIDKDDHTCCW